MPTEGGASSEFVTSGRGMNNKGVFVGGQGVLCQKQVVGQVVLVLKHTTSLAQLYTYSSMVVS